MTDENNIDINIVSGCVSGPKPWGGGAQLAEYKELLRECQNYIINTPVLEQGN